MNPLLKIAAVAAGVALSASAFATATVSYATDLATGKQVMFQTVGAKTKITDLSTGGF